MSGKTGWLKWNLRRKKEVQKTLELQTFTGEIVLCERLCISFKTFLSYRQAAPDLQQSSKESNKQETQGAHMACAPISLSLTLTSNSLL